MRFAVILTIFVLYSCSSGEAPEPSAPRPDTAPQITVVPGGAGKAPETGPFATYTITGETAVRYAPDGKETPLTRELGAIASVRNRPYETVRRSLLMKRLSKNFIVKCSACHDDYGNGVIGPSLLGRTGEEVYGMIAAYRSGGEKNVLMIRLVSKMTEEEIRFIADDISRFNEEMRKEAGK